MRKSETIKTIGLIISIIIIFCLSIYIFILKLFANVDNDYKKLGLKIEYYSIEYITTYGYDEFCTYKVYKIKNYYSSSMKELKSQLENSNLWSKNKFYEYIMKEFYEIKEDEEIEIDREDLYYYDKNGIYAIFDIKNAKLYYFKNGLFNYHKDYNEILGVDTSNYITREIYSVRGGPQNDGLDYYVYELTEENRKEIQETLSKSQIWSKNRLENDILDSFEHNEEVLSIENGYYHYELVCRTSDENKKYNFTEEEATGYEVGVYDIDKNILYYYWTSI
ncbi:MAG: hypothetical protein IJE68_03710 [Clostridia bacterium]|nr:hypothetical protein [Clostridia bacterium]